MTSPTPAQILDQAVIDAGRELARAWQERSVDPAAIAAARERLLNARDARGYEDA